MSKPRTIECINPSCEEPSRSQLQQSWCKNCYERVRRASARGPAYIAGRSETLRRWTGSLDMIGASKAKHKLRMVAGGRR